MLLDRRAKVGLRDSERSIDFKLDVFMDCGGLVDFYYYGLYGLLL
jgi:hypothetical protein